MQLLKKILIEYLFMKNKMYVLCLLVYVCTIQMHHEKINDFLYRTVFCYSPFDAAYLTTWFIYVMSIGYVCYYLYCAIKNKTRLSRLHLYMVIILIIHYCFYRVDCNYCFEYVCNSCFAYVDIYPFLLCLFVANSLVNDLHIVIKKNNCCIKQLYYNDEEIKSIEDDELGFHLYAKHYAEKIKTLSKSERHNISINGVWGSGKSSFVNLILKELPDEEYEKIYFYPRKCFSANTIQEDFFNLLSSHLKKYDTSLQRSIKQYVSLLSLSEKTIFGTLNDALSNIFDDTISKEKISDVISKINKHVVVFIDDLDRLTSEELSQVFRIIHANADFQNVIYITAFDKEYVDNLLSHNAKVSFTDKFFNIAYKVPCCSEKKLFDFFTNKISNYYRPRLLSDEEYQQLDDFQKQKYLSEEKYITGLEVNKQIFLKFLKNIRDIKLFCNNLFSGYIDKGLAFSDFALLELLRHIDESKYLKLYQDRDSYLEEKNGVYYYRYNDSVIKADDTSESLCIIQLLFPNDNKGTSKNQMNRINSSFSFDAYFEYGKKAVDINRINNLLNCKISYDSVEIESLIQDENKSVLQTYLIQKDTSELQNGIQWENYIKLLIYFVYKTGNENLCAKVIDLLSKTSLLNPIGLGDTTYYRDIIKQCLVNYPPSSCKINLELNGIVRNYNNKLIWSTKDVVDINLQCLKNYIESKPQYDNRLFDLHLACIDGQDSKTNRLHINEEANALVRDAVKRHPDYFLTNFVGTGGQSSNPNTLILGFKPFWEDIIGDANKMEKFINDDKFNDIEHIHRTRNFWKIFKANDFEAPIIHDVDPQYYLESDLNPYMQKYDKVVEVNNKFKELKENKEVTTDEIIDKCRVFIDMLDKNNCELKWNYIVRNEIETYINDLKKKK